MTKVTLPNGEYSDDGSAARDMRGYGYMQNLLPFAQGLLDEGKRIANDALVVFAARDATAASESNAAGSAAAAISAKTAAETARAQANTIATNSAGSATAASTSAGNAATAASTATTKAADAATAASNAAGSASTAAAKASEAVTSAGNAAASATAAANARTAAETARTQAGTSATNASTSAGAAAASATNAAGSAGTATTKAGEAAASATAAADSATTATTWAGAAGNSADAAAASANAADRKAAAAAASATDAAASATAASAAQAAAEAARTEAGTSATTAAASATAASGSAQAAETAARRAETAAGNADPTYIGDIQGLQAALDARVALTGNQAVAGTKTFKNELVHAPDSGTGSVTIRVASGNNAQVSLQTGTTNRWAMRANANPENGNNSGSNWELLRYSDTGSLLGAAITASRETGNVSIPSAGIRTGVPALGAYNLNNNDLLGTEVSVLVNTGAEAAALNFPPAIGTGPQWWNVKTYGALTRLTQIATFGFTGGQQWGMQVRNRHDSTWSAWRTLAWTDSPVFSGSVSVDNAATTDALYEARKGGLRRWRWGASAATGGEPGNHVGSDFGVYSYNDDGSYRAQVLTISRATGEMYVPKFKVDNPAIQGTPTIMGAAGSERLLAFTTGTSLRWKIGTSAEAETGSNAGSHLAFYAYTDAGAYIGRHLAINRASGRMDIAGQVVISNANLTVAPASGNANIELGSLSGAESTPFIDFHSGATPVDFDFRIIASGGTGVSKGGNLAFSGAILNLTDVGYVATKTPSAGDNTNHVANTQFVQSAIAGAPVVVSGNVALVNGQRISTLYVKAGATITLPSTPINGATVKVSVATGVTTARLDPNGQAIRGDNSVMNIDVEGVSFMLTYVNGEGWV